MKVNGKGKFKIWAKHPATNRVLNGGMFHLYDNNIKQFCGTLRSHGWEINQIKRVVMPK